MEFGEKLREILEKKGLTQKEFAQEINMNYAHTNKFFTGRTPNMEFILKVVNRYPEIDLNWLLLPQGSRKTSLAVSGPNNPYDTDVALNYVKEIEGKLAEFKEFLTQS